MCSPSLSFLRDLLQQWQQPWSQLSTSQAWSEGLTIYQMCIRSSLPALSRQVRRVQGSCHRATLKGITVTTLRNSLFAQSLVYFA